MGPGLETTPVCQLAALAFCRRCSCRLGIRSRASGAHATWQRRALLSHAHPISIVFVCVYYLYGSCDLTASRTPRARGLRKGEQGGRRGGSLGKEKG
eukprot:7570203-Pyramimonas_sp.AAC.1